MSYISKIINKSIKLNTANNIKIANKLIKQNLKSLMSDIKLPIKDIIGKNVSNNVPLVSNDFSSGVFNGKHGSRDYKLYIPQKKSNKPLSLLVMLHGCRQNPDDFSIGTDMNTLAEKENMLVLYPSQTLSHNQNKCWNWFRVERNNIGESQILLEMTNEIVDKYSISKGHVYVAGMSAGAAMAVILATQYPETYRAAGIHSGLPYRASTSINSALYAMSHGRREPFSTPIKTPMIVFHGDRDDTVKIKNSEQIIEDIILSQDEKPHVQIVKSSEYTRMTYRDSEKSLAEYWILHNEGHNWSGGNRAGSYTSETGPSASKEMIRFFTSRGLNEL